MFIVTAKFSWTLDKSLRHSYACLWNQTQPGSAMRLPEQPVPMGTASWPRGTVSTAMGCQAASQEFQHSSYRENHNPIKPNPCWVYLHRKFFTAQRRGHEQRLAFCSGIWGEKLPETLTLMGKRDQIIQLRSTSQKKPFITSFLVLQYPFLSLEWGAPQRQLLSFLVLP